MERLEIEGETAATRDRWRKYVKIKDNTRRIIIH